MIPGCNAEDQGTVLLGVGWGRERGSGEGQLAPTGGAAAVVMSSGAVDASPTRLSRTPQGAWGRIQHLIIGGRRWEVGLSCAHLFLAGAAAAAGAEAHIATGRKR